MHLKNRNKNIYSHDLNYRSGSNIDISSMVDKYFNNVCMSIITCIMKGCPSILLSKQDNSIVLHYVESYTKMLGYIFAILSYY